MFKEIINFDQLSLLQKGVYMMISGSEVYVWIGSQVEDEDLFDILLQQPIKVDNNLNFNIVHEFYEPHLFTQLFPRWKSRTK